MYLDKKISLRLRKKEFTQINKIVKKNPVYDNANHFIRCAIIEKLREEAR